MQKYVNLATREEDARSRAAALAYKEPLEIHNGMMFPRDGLSPPTPPLSGEGRAQDSRPSRLPLPRAPSRILAALSPPPPSPRRRLSTPQAGGGDTAPASPRRGRGSRPGEPPTPQGNLHPAPQLERRNQTLPPCPPPATPKQNKQTVNAAAPPCPGRDRPAGPIRPPPGRGSPRRRRAPGGARTPGPPWCSRCWTGSPGRSPGCWAAKTLRGGRGREKKQRLKHPHPAQGVPSRPRLPSPGTGCPPCMVGCQPRSSG